MKSIFNLSLFLISFCSLSAQNDSIPKEGKRKIPSANARRIPTMSAPKSILPQEDNQFKLPMGMDRNMNNMPTLKPKEMPMKTNLTTRGRSAEDNLIDPWGFVLTERHLNRWYREIRGIRVMTDKGATIGVGGYSNMRVDMYVSVGFQFNPIVYLGLGQGYSLSLNKHESVAPTFVNAKFNFLDEQKTLYFDLKAGYSFLEGKGVFLNPNFGFSFGKHTSAFNISAGYSFQKAKVNNKGVTSRYNYHGVVFRFGYEFNVFSIK